LLKGAEVSCKSCQSKNQHYFDAEIAIHFPGLKGLNQPHVLVFPQIVVCLDCGFTEFAIPENLLRLLGKSDSANAKT
jgi:predicted nucleic-acid-binding Zn-ribbon protein